MKYWAYYCSPSNWGLMNDNDYTEWLEDSRENVRDADYLYSSYSTLAAAKKYLTMHLRGDRDDAIMSLVDVRSYKAKKKVKP